MRIIKIFALISALTNFSTAEARDIWIHAVGIDTQNKSQNSISFYESAEDFLKTCKNSTRKPECHLLINTDLTFTEDSNVAQVHLTPNEGAATRQKVLDLIKNSIKRVSAADQLIISLQDHGSPSQSLSGNSCIYFGYESICDDELSLLLKDVSKGTRVFVNADGCYSGAFTNVVKGGACARTASDQLHHGSGDVPSLWRNINRVNAKGIIQLKVPTESGTAPRFSSQLIMRSICKDARAKFKDDEKTFEALADFGKLRVIRDMNDVSEMVYHFGDMTSGLKNIIQILSASPCEQMNLPQSTCSALKRIQANNNEAQKFFGNIDQLFSQYFSLKDKMESLLSDENTVAIDKNVVSAVRQIIFGDIDPHTFDDWPQDKLSAIRSLTKQILPLKWARATAKTEMAKVLQASQKFQSYQDWVDVYECLLPDQFDDMEVGFSALEPQTVGYWNDIAKRSQPLSFTEQDYQSARQCESQIQF